MLESLSVLQLDPLAIPAPSLVWVTGGGNRSGTYTTSTGKSGTFDATRQRNEEGSISRQQNWTNQDGKTHSRSVVRTFDAEASTINRNVTGPGGHTRNRTLIIPPETSTE